MGGRSACRYKNPPRIGENGLMATPSRPRRAASPGFPRAAGRVLLLVLLALLVACASRGPDRRMLRDALFDYSSAIRWGELDAALGHVDPDYLAKHPLTALERRRFQQLQVSGYYVRSSSQDSEGRVHQVVEIRLVNRHTLEERAVTDRQTWRWDSERSRWWLTTGLPDFAPAG